MLKVEDKPNQERPPLHKKGEKPLRPGIESLDEDAIQESLDNLDILLSNLQNKKQK